MNKETQESSADQTQQEVIARQPLGVLLVHGLNGCQSDMEEIDALLVAQGVVTVNLLLPGHGTQVEDMLPVGWPEWSAAVREATRELLERCERVFLIGHSLGGALCLHTAAHEPVMGLVTLCAPLHMPLWMLPAVRLTQRFTSVLPTVREDIRDAEARRKYTRQVYRWTPMAPVESMLQYLPRLRAELPSITVPILIMNALHDHVVPARDGQAIYNLIGSRDKKLITFRRSYHVIMKDHDREEVLAQTLAFVQRIAGPLPGRQEEVGKSH